MGISIPLAATDYRFVILRKIRLKNKAYLTNCNLLVLFETNVRGETLHAVLLRDFAMERVRVQVELLARGAGSALPPLSADSQ